MVDDGVRTRTGRMYKISRAAALEYKSVVQAARFRDLSLRKSVEQAGVLSVVTNATVRNLKKKHATTNKRRGNPRAVGTRKRSLDPPPPLSAAVCDAVQRYTENNFSPDSRIGRQYQNGARHEYSSGLCSLSLSLSLSPGENLTRHIFQVFPHGPN